jgi:hypothetical protein
LVFVGVFLAVVFSYACTEYQLTRLEARRRVMVGEGFPLLVILGANFVSFAVMWLSAVVFLYASRSDSDFYLYAALVCAGAQSLWLSQHLWCYYRDHVRLRYEN